MVAQVLIHTQWGVPVTIVLSGSVGFFTLVRLAMMSNLGGAAGRLASIAGRLKIKIGMRNE